MFGRALDTLMPLGNPTPMLSLITCYQKEASIFHLLCGAKIFFHLWKKCWKKLWKLEYPLYSWAHFREISLWDFATRQEVSLENVYYTECLLKQIQTLIDYWQKYCLFDLLSYLSYNFCKSLAFKNLRQLKRYLFHKLFISLFSVDNLQSRTYTYIQ